MIDIETGEKRYWKDDRLSSKAQNILAFNNTGLYRVEYPLNEKSVPRLICGEMTKELFDFPKDAGPEQCYRLWEKGIVSSYREILSETRQLLLQGVQAECTYQWNHPKLGKIFVRTGGNGEIVDGVQILHGYHHSMKDTRIMERKDDSQLLVDAMSGIYFCSYYVDIDHDCFYIEKNAPGEKYLEMQENKATEVMRRFVNALVSPLDRDKMIKFMDFASMKKRMQNEVHLDCEYRSLTDKGWCRATFFPVKKDGEGYVTHVLFVVTSLDENKAQEAKEGALGRKNLASLYNHVPGGIVMYEWDGTSLTTLHISKYYAEQYGDTIISKEGSNKGGPDFRRVHPNDLAGYQEAIHEALTETHSLEYVYRVWNQVKNRYVWVKIDAVSEDQADGTSIIYALYTDVTTQKEAEAELERNQASMKAALAGSNLLSYEYDPGTGTGICFTDENYFGLPKVINQYPESLRGMDLFYPGDDDIFIETVHKMDDVCGSGAHTSADTARCDVRIKKNGEYGWYSCIFNLFFDPGKQRRVAILTVIDISERKALMQDYEDQIQTLIRRNDSSLSVGTVNLTNDTFSEVHLDEKIKKQIEAMKTVDELFGHYAPGIVEKEKREEYLSVFNRRRLLELAEQGIMHVEQEHQYYLTPQHIEWVQVGMDLVKNPVNGEITGVYYGKNIQNVRLANLLLAQILKMDYLVIAIMNVATEEYYLYNSTSGKQENSNYHFWDVIGAVVASFCDGMTKQEISEHLFKQKVYDVLDKEQSFTWAFDGVYQGNTARLGVKAHYLDERHDYIVVALRNITDEALIDRLRHDSEHDPLTDLYNRNTVFRKTVELLKEHPDEQFVIAHIDMKHFRLYNTFFGDSAGDKLLCDVADLFRWMSHDYEYWVYGRIEADVFCACFPYDEKKYRKHLDKVFRILKDYRTDFLIEPVLGIYFITDPEMPVEAMFTRATLAAKSVQPGTPYATVIYDETLERKLSEDQQIISEMQTAIDQGQFQVYLQPKYSLQTSKPIGAEALVRWIHPQRGLISPGKFIPLFESNGFITTLDHYMWEQVCLLLNKWKAEGKPLIPISVNVSRLSMFGQSTVDFLIELVKKHEIDPKYLELELTESAYIDDPDEMKTQMNALQNAGFKILLDDFGSGYSCLNTLKELPVDVLKMDMKFLSADNQDHRGNMVVSSIIRMSKLLNLSVIAEGVELREQADFLKGIGCEYVQGFLFAKPMPAEVYEKYITQWESTSFSYKAEKI